MKAVSLFKYGAGLVAAVAAMASWSFTPSLQPPESTAVPGNVMLALSVEFPTGLQVSYSSANYSSIVLYDGYFDNRKCYTYSTANEVFSPTGAVSATGTCGNSEWSGNLLNWLTMTNLDQFRSVMTGGTRDNFSAMNGTHPGDTSTRTVLIRSFSDRNSYNPLKRLAQTDPVPSALRSATAKWVRSGGYGSKFIVSDSNNFADLTSLAQQQASCAATPLPSTGICFNIRVEACQQIPATGIPVVPREANCRAKYTGAPKPEGLIQEYAGALRFGAFGYLNQTGNDRSGGVLRSAMKSVGPVAATSTGVTTNANKEWNETTGVIFANPDPADATASGVSNSGLMNYLNKFGYTAGYKGNDPVSELYYAALLYLRGYAPPTTYSDSLTTDYKDGFPVITGSAHQRGGSRDPMINSCQRNFMLSIGDIYTHCDGNLPGSTKAGCVGGTPSDPSGLNVQSLWDTTRTMEGMPDARDSTGLNGWAGGAGTPTPYVAGLAHWANTNDIRSDISGTQTVSSYFVDVLENGNGVGGWPAAGTLKTQYWLAAKYGGFDTAVANSTNPNLTPTSWDKNSDGVPDTWFAGSTPALLRSSLSAAFADIATKSSASSASSAAVTSSRQTSNSQIIYAGYNPKDWSGTVSACTPAQSATECAATPVWEASRWFKTSAPTFVTTPLTDSTRKIFTSWRTSTAFSSMPFQWASLNTSQQTILLAADGLGSQRLAYIRGSRTNEGGLFRTRAANLLGDIVNSGVTYLAGSSPALTGPRYPGHAAYRTSQKTRPPVVYVGSNDGMLHAFSGTDGKELFGYIPSSVFSNLPTLSDLNFQHRYFVDSTPMVGDIQKNPTTWGTILVGGLGAGGKGYYALDITNQKTFASASETALSSLPIWEFTNLQDPDLGYTFNKPATHPVTGAHLQIAKVADSTVTDGVWRVIVGNGMGSTNGDAILFMLNANTGAADIKLSTGNTTNNGLAPPTPVDTDRDGLIDTVYAGDALGDLHKFQFSRTSGSNKVLAKPGDAGAGWSYLGKIFASGEPITTAPSVASCTGVGWNVAFGTGKLSEDVDYSDSSRRGFYAVLDNNPSSALTVTNNSLATITYSFTSLGSGNVGRTWGQPNLSGKLGWKMFFTGGERVLTNSTQPPDTGVVLFGTTKPSGDVCTPGNSGYIMAVNLCSGKIGNLIVNGVTVGGLAIDSTGVVEVSNTYTDNKNEPKVVCNQDDCKDNPPTLGLSVAPRGRYSWRELLTK